MLRQKVYLVAYLKIFNIFQQHFNDELPRLTYKAYQGRKVDRQKIIKIKPFEDQNILKDQKYCEMKITFNIKICDLVTINF